jgi:hypothetical protein
MPLQAAVPGGLDAGLDDITVRQLTQFRGSVTIRRIQLRELNDAVAGHDVTAAQGSV